MPVHLQSLSGSPDRALVNVPYCSDADLSVAPEQSPRLEAGGGLQGVIPGLMESEEPLQDSSYMGQWYTHDTHHS